ncbi:MAG: hypothetical protein GMKNLPBB_01282 [Myxococcota bacterium]|nr:hypothetical protein [Myxococcota bacterium]
MEPQSRSAANLDQEEAYRYHFEQGSAYYGLQKYREALEHFRLADEAIPGRIQCLDMLGQTFYRLEDFTGSAEVYRRLVHDHPTEPTMLLNWGMALLKAKQYRHALDPLRSLVRLKPDQKKAHGLLAMALAECGDLEGAKHHFQQAGLAHKIAELETRVIRRATTITQAVDAANPKGADAPLTNVSIPGVTPLTSLSSSPPSPVQTPVSALNSPPATTPAAPPVAPAAEAQPEKPSTAAAPVVLSADAPRPMTASVDKHIRALLNQTLSDSGERPHREERVIRPRTAVEEVQHLTLGDSRDEIPVPGNRQVEGTPIHAEDEPPDESVQPEAEVAAPEMPPPPPMEPEPQETGAVASANAEAQLGAMVADGPEDEVYEVDVNRPPTGGGEVPVVEEVEEETPPPLPGSNGQSGEAAYALSGAVAEEAPHRNTADMPAVNEPAAAPPGAETRRTNPVGAAIQLPATPSGAGESAAAETSTLKEPEPAARARPTSDTYRRPRTETVPMVKQQQTASASPEAETATVQRPLRRATEDILPVEVDESPAGPEDAPPSRVIEPTDTVQAAPAPTAPAMAAARPAEPPVKTGSTAVTMNEFASAHPFPEPTSGMFSLKDKVIHVHVNGEVHCRMGNMIGLVGAPRPTEVFRKVKGMQRGAFGRGPDSVWRWEGKGQLLFDVGDHRTEVMAIPPEGVYLIERYMLGFGGDVNWLNHELLYQDVTLNIINLTGKGEFCTKCAEEINAFAAHKGDSVFLPAERVIGWTGKILPRLVPPPFPETGASVPFLALQGEGVILVRSPYRR